MTRPIVLLTDYGHRDPFVGICHGVIARIAPDAHVIDLTHAVPRQDVLRGAVELARSIPYMPVDAVFVAVVDPCGIRPSGGRAHRRRGRPRGSGQRRALPRGRDARRRGGRGRDRGRGSLAGVPHVPRPRRVRAGGGASRGRTIPRGARPGCIPRRCNASRCRGRWSRSVPSAPASRPPTAREPPDERDRARPGVGGVAGGPVLVVNGRRLPRAARSPSCPSGSPDHRRLGRVPGDRREPRERGDDARLGRWRRRRAGGGLGKRARHHPGWSVPGTVRGPGSRTGAARSWRPPAG